MDKLKKLNLILRKLQRVVLAYSGGLDSTFLLKVSIDALGKNNVLAVTAQSETYPLSEYREAIRIAKRMGARHLTIKTEELKIENFKSNPVNRCYYCKRELFKKLDDIRKKRGMNHVVDGTNFDDLKDIRYGRKAAAELGVRSPLLEAKIGKKDIRKFSKKMSLPTWDKQPLACLASRFPFHSDIAEKDLRRVDAAETYLRKLGFKQVRVRIHGSIARLELAQKDLSKAVKLREAITRGLKKLGFVYVSLDLAGYRTGSMHEAV